MSKAFLLVVDDGHGGADSGAVSGAIKEDDRNLLLGRAVSAAAKAQGWRVLTTRDSDKFIELADRYEAANEAGAQAFVSLHHDWKLGEQAVIYPNSNDKREAASQRLADAISGHIDRLAPTASKTYADKRGLAVLRGTKMAAVIVEASRIQDPYEVAAMAEAIVRGICEYHGVEYVEVGAKPKPKPHVEVEPKHKAHPLLQRGSKGPEVEELQHFLIGKGISCGRWGADGDFGEGTEAAVRRYQMKRLPRIIRGVHQWDGIVGPNTWAAIDANK